MKKHLHVLGQILPRKIKAATLIAISCCMAILRTDAQGYLNASQQWGLSGADAVNELIADNSGNSYLLATVAANTFPVSIPPAPVGSNRKSVLIKMDPDGNALWSRYLPLSTTGNTTISEMVLSNGELYLLGVATGTDITTTNGSAAGGGGSDIIYVRVNAANGTVLNTAYLGGSGAESTGLGLAVENGGVYVTYTTTSADIPVTNTSAFTTGYDHVIQKLNSAGTILYSTYTGSVATTATNTEQVSLAVENDKAYLGLVVSSTNNFTVTNGSTVQGSYDFGLIKLDANGNRVFSTVYGGSGNETQPVIAVNNENIYLSGHSLSSNYPATDGSAHPNAPMKRVLTRFNNTGTVIFSSNQAGVDGFMDVPRMQWYNGALYLMGGTRRVTGQYLPYAPSFNMTDNGTGYHFLIKINPSTGQTIFATRFGSLPQALTSGSDFVVDNDRIYSITSTNTGASFTTDGFNKISGLTTYFTVHSTDGRLLFASDKFGGVTGSTNSAVAANGNYVYMTQTTQATANNLTLTKPVMGTLNNVDIAWASYKFCPTMPVENDLLPATQTICMGGFTQPITGNKVSFSPANMPLMYRAGVAISQMEIPARYQWQVATAAGGPWTSIAGPGTQKDYTPPANIVNRYYRRVVLNPAGCDDTVSISGVAQVIVSGNTAPAITGAIFNTCTGTPVDIAVTVSGGAAPYSYIWDNGLTSTTAIATATPVTNSVYTATVTDNNGCQQIGQAIVNAYAADAGPASVSSCAGSPVRIGTPPPAGLAGVTYSWTPTAGLDDATIAQPLANPATTTIYTLSMTIPTSGGSTCTTTDQITVNAVAAPTNTSFAGIDQAVCLGGTLSLGSVAQSGFTYTWAPGNYLNTSAGSTVTFNAGSEQPMPNPITYFVTAASNGCTFFDEVTVSVLEVDAGKNICGPRTVGTGDKMSGVTGKVFLWEKVSGPGFITGATNTPNTTVSASTSASTTYRLTVSYLGVSCSDLVEVPECTAGSGGCPDLDIDVIAPHGCPSTAFGPVTLNAKPANLNASDWTYSWSAVPAGGISATSGTSITLTDNIERDITLRVTSIDNPSFSCTKTIHVNGPSWALPSFTAQDHSICAATTVSIGASNVTGYSYNWTGITGAQKTISNPTVTPVATTEYYVTVTDDLSGCITRDTSRVVIKPLIADPGSDWTTCSNTVVQLGAPALPGYTYSWSPAVASYQDGTSFTSAEPKVLVATSQDFTLTVTDAATGCSRDSVVRVVIDNSPNLPAIANKTICAGAGTTIGNAPLKNVDYSWAPSTGLSSTTVAQPVASPSSTQTYTLTITYKDAAGSPACTKSGDVTVTVNAPQITMRDTTICPSSALYNLGSNVTTSAAASYSWTPAFLVTSPAALNTTVKANPTRPTTYTLTITDANGCRVSAGKTVSSTVAAPDAGTNSMICVGASVQLGSASNTGAINWTVTPAIAGTLNTTSSPAPVFTPASGDAGKSFVFTISQNNAGCTSTAQVTVVVKELTLPRMPVQTICANGSTTIGVTAVPNISYVWDPATDLSDPYAATTVVNNVTNTRIYTLTAIDLNGCFATSQAVVGVNPTPAPTVSIPDVTTTVGVNPPAFDPQINPGAGTYAYNWSPASQLDNPYIKNATARPGGIGNTTFTLALTDANGCTSTARTQLRVAASTPLPIILSSFTASAKKCAASLNWEVQSAHNFAYFTVERSSDGIEFSALKKIGYTAYRTSYSYEDTHIGSGKWLYRLKLVDLTGAVSYSKTEAATVGCATNATLSVFPNPVNSYVQINSSKPVQRISVLSYTGSVVINQVYDQTQPGLIQLPFNNTLSPGMYILMVWDTEGTAQQVKLVKE